MQSPKFGGSDHILSPVSIHIASPKLLTMHALEKHTDEYRATMQAFKWAGLGILAVAAACVIFSQAHNSTAMSIQTAVPISSPSDSQVMSAKAYTSAYTLNKSEGSIFSSPASRQVAMPQYLASQASAPSTKLQ